MAFYRAALLRRFYPLTPYSTEPTAWMVWQFDSPSPTSINVLKRTAQLLSLLLDSKARVTIWHGLGTEYPWRRGYANEG